LANSAYELSRATLTHWSYSAGVSVTTRLVVLEHPDHLVIQRRWPHFAKVRLRFPAGGDQHVLLLLVEAAEALLDISTGSYMNHSAFPPAR